MSSAPRGLAPCEGLQCLLMKTGHTGPLAKPRCRPQAGKSGDPRSRTSTVAPGPKARPDLVVQGGERARAKNRGPKQPAALGAAWRLIGCGRPCFPTPPYFAPS